MTQSSKALRDDDVLAELGAELGSVTPSPEFVVRVRERIAAAPKTAIGPGWLWLVGATAAAAMAIAIALRPPQEMDLPIVAETATAAPRPAPAPSITEARSRVVSTTVRRAAAPAADPAFLVITDQRAVLDRLWRAAEAPPRLRASEPTALPAPSVVVDAEGSMIVPDLVVQPIVVPPIGAPAGGQGRVQRVVSPQAMGSPR